MVSALAQAGHRIEAQADAGQELPHAAPYFISFILQKIQNSFDGGNELGVLGQESI